MIVARPWSLVQAANVRKHQHHLRVTHCKAVLHMRCTWSALACVHQATN
eukprot:gene20897-biopygen4114